MNDLTLARVEVNQSVQQLVSPGDNYVRRERLWPLSNNFCQIRAVDKLHHEEGAVRLGEIVTDPWQNRMIELSEQVRLPLKLFPERLIPGQGLFQCDSVGKVQIDSLIDCTHSTFAHLTDYAI